VVVVVVALVRRASGLGLCLRFLMFYQFKPVPVVLAALVVALAALVCLRG
jgi:hypothetical protein